MYTSLVTLKVRFIDFWPGFDAPNSLFVRLIQSETSKEIEVIRDPSVLVDIEFVSVFCFDSMRDQIWSRIRAKTNIDKHWEYMARAGRGFRFTYANPAKKRVWYTGENKRFPLGQFDLTVSFDPTDHLAANVFFPYWMLRLDWGLQTSGYEISPQFNLLSAPREAVKRELNACSFANLRESLRELVNDACVKVFPLERYGFSVGRSVESKSLTSAAFGMQVCTENDLYPDYVTEKLQESWSSRNVPIWSGLDNSGYFNPEAVINVTLLSYEQMITRFEAITVEELMYRQAQPLLLKQPSIDPLRDALLSLI